jgi:peptidoglycan/xylan/chitin deacetylase (PgdA/CDA1 family)
MACHSRSRPGLPAALLAVLLAAGSSAAAAAGAQPVPILAYHHVGAPPAGARNPALWVRPSTLRAQLRALDGVGYEAVTLDAVWRAWHGAGRLPRHPVVLSFDDGYASQARVALPALRGEGWPGVLYLQSARVGRRGGLSTAQVRAMIRAGWEIDAHSVSHPDLTKVSAKRLTAEVAGSRRALRQTFGVSADFFAYPYGRQNARVRAAVRRAGFLGAFTTHRSLARRSADPFALGRVLVARSDSPSSVLRMVRTGG